jgi:peroxiredoxin
MIFENFQLADFDLYAFISTQKGLIVFFRGSWCHHCRRQLSELRDNFSTIQKKGYEIVAISNDSTYKSSLLKTFLHLPFPVLADEDSSLITKLNLLTSYHEKSVSKPAIFIIDENKNIIWQHIGTDYDDIPSATEIMTNL